MGCFPVVAVVGVGCLTFPAELHVEVAHDLGVLRACVVVRAVLQDAVQEALIPAARTSEEHCNRYQKPEGVQDVRVVGLRAEVVPAYEAGARDAAVTRRRVDVEVVVVAAVLG